MATNPRAHPDDAEPLPDYTPVALRSRHDGWTAERQRTFLIALAETGCISEACRHARITARSAYRLRAHPMGKTFASAWDQALVFATTRLMTLAYERAIKGGVHETWRNGKLIAETRAPSDRLLIYLLGMLVRSGPSQRTYDAMAYTRQAADWLAPALDRLKDSEVPADALSWVDYRPQPPLATEQEAVPFDEDMSDEDRRADDDFADEEAAGKDAADDDEDSAA